MKLKTRVFELSNGKYPSLSELAKAMGISVAQVCRVRQGKRKVSEKFIIGAMKAFPGYKFDDLFYFVPDGSGNEGTTNEAGMVAGSRRDEVVKLGEAGESYAEIGRRSKGMLTTGDVAQLLNLHVNTVRKWSNKGILKSYRISPRGDRRFRREDVDGFLRKGEIE